MLSINFIFIFVHCEVIAQSQLSICSINIVLVGNIDFAK